METNITLEQLVEQAKQTSDFRSKVMNELRTNIETQLIPAVCSVLNAYGVEELYIKSDFKLITKMGGHETPDRDPVNEREYCYSINADGTLSGYYIDFDKYGDAEWKESNLRWHIDFADCVIPKRYLASFVEHAKSSMKHLNDRMQKQAAHAQQSLDSLNEIK